MYLVHPINRCSRRILPQLRRADYDVVYQEFNGFHTVPTEIANSALKWFGS
jgi:phospholipase/carboxylesterase